MFIYPCSTLGAFSNVLGASLKAVRQDSKLLSLMQLPPIGLYSQAGEGRASESSRKDVVTLPGQRVGGKGSVDEGFISLVTRKVALELRQLGAEEESGHVNLSRVDSEACTGPGSR